MLGKDGITIKSKPRGWLALLLVFVGLALEANAATPLFTVHDAKTELVGDVYRLDADLDLKLTPEVLTALDNGVTLTIVLDIEVYTPSRYLWDGVLASLEQRYEIQYHALSDQYLLRSLNSGSQFVYSSLDETLSALGRIEQLPVIDAHLLRPEQSYKVRVRCRLDLGSLPVPLQLKAYVSSDWWLNSGWYSWDL
ncbi:MAG TPA: DUF4390 domain-containing protein [Gammaproteobacteria bacterium]|nr:DUF4390 domain-containing protein [Gammaproteobacteria bacterium]